MRMRGRLLVIARLLPAALLLGMAAKAGGQVPHADHATTMPSAPSPTVPASRWSDPASWPDGRVPRAGDAVTVGRGRHILLDVAPPELRSLTINGKLSFSDDLDIELRTEWILVGGGELDIGSEARPHTRQATITLTDQVPNEDVNAMGDRGIMMLAGTLSLHGDRQHSWTKLARTAKAGSTRIRVLDAGGWRPGDAIVLASTDFDPKQAETRMVTAISGDALTLNQPLLYMHFGAVTYGVDERGEVGLLTRNIRIQASDDARRSYFGGHIMAMAGSKVYASGVELVRMGQNMHLARYPIHWHIGGDGQGQYLQNSSIHDSYSRCVTVHGTDNVRVENNVTFNTVGHCFFLEDGVETGNQFIRNLGILTKCHPDGKPCVPTNLGPFKVPGGTNFDMAGQGAKDVLIPSDNTVSTFWITNPNNIYRDNVAAGSEATGFWLAFPEHPTGAFLNRSGSAAVWPRRTALREFKGNTAHSNFDGFMADRGPRPNGTFTTGAHITLADPADANSAQLETVIEDFTSYKNRNGGLWARGEMDLFRNLKLADNAIGYTHASANFGRSAYTSRVIDSVFVGESANIGNPTTPAERAYGRSLPEPDLADFPIRGYEFYDYRHELDNVTFVNFKDNATRRTGAISYLLFTSFGMSSNNTVRRAKFVNAKPVYFPPVEHKWSNDDYGNGTYRTAVFHDLDGSVGGVPDAFILLHDGTDGITADSRCDAKPAWNAAVCRGDFGRLAIADPSASGMPGPSIARPGAKRPTPPAILLSRNGKESVLAGETNVRAGSELKVTTGMPSVALRLSELDAGSWVIFELPRFASADAGLPQDSLEALRKATATSYHKGGDTLWVKLVSNGTGARRAGPGAGATSIQVNR